MNTRNTILSAALFALISLASCSSPKSLMTGGNLDYSIYETSTAAVDMVSDKDKLDKNHVKIAYIKVIGSENSTQEEMLKKLEQEAASLGAHALVQVQDLKSEKEEAEPKGMFVDIIYMGSNAQKDSQTETKGMTAVAVRYANRSLASK